MNFSNDSTFHRRLKRKYMRTEAEKACAKEAAASRLALEALQKELATTDQMSSFVIEESCTETTVENFIPHGEEPFMDNLNQLDNVPLQVVNYADLNQSVLNNSTQLINANKPVLVDSILQYDVMNNSQKAQESAAEKLKQILGGDIPSNVEIMFKTSDGNFVSLTDEVLQNITRESLQYQVIDEHGRAGEVQQLTINIKDPSENPLNPPQMEEDPIAKYVNPIENITIQEEPIVDTKFDLMPKDLKMDEMSTDQSILEAIIENEKREREMKFVTENTLPDLQDTLEDGSPLQMDVPLKNLQKNKLDPLKKRSNLRKHKTLNILGERSFCDEFLNTTVELTDGNKDIYSSDITCIESVDPLSQEAVDVLTSAEITEEKDLQNTEGIIFSSKKKRLDTSNDETDVNSSSVDELCTRKTRSNKHTDVTRSPETTIEIKLEDQLEKYEIRSRKVPVRKRIK